jgi:hypothetical protein
MKKVLASIAFGCGLALAAPLSAAPPAPPPAKDKAAKTAGDEEQAGWVQRLDDAAARVVSAQKQVDQLFDAKGRGAARRYPRGDAKDKYLKELDAARKELADAKRALPALVDEARRAGIPNGVLDRYEGLVAESPAADDEDESYGEQPDDSSPPAKADDDHQEDQEQEEAE